MSTEPGYQAPSVTVATSLPKRGAGSSVLIVPVVSTGDDDRPGAVVAAAEPFLSADAVGRDRGRPAGAGGHRRQRAGAPAGGAVAAGGQRADDRPGQTAIRVAGRHDPPRRRRGGAVAGRHRGGDHHAGRVARRGRLLRRRRGADPGQLPVHRLPQRQDRTERRRAAQDHRAVATAKDAKKQSAHGAAVATAVATARDLVNTPPSHLFPAEFAKRAKALGESVGLEVEVLDDKALQKGRLRRGDRRRPGLVAAAAAGAADPPRFAAGQESRSRPRRWRWSARASRSTPAASRSSRRRRCIT